MATNIAQERSSYSPSWFGLWIFLIQIITILVLIPSDWLARVLDKEALLLQNTFGADTAAYIIGTGQQWYHSIFVETGISQYVYSFFIPSDAERARTVGMQDIGQGNWFPWIEGRGAAIKLVLLLFFERIAQLLMWLPFLIIMLIPSSWDGYMTWKMKFHSFEYSSPWFHRFSVKIISLFVALSFIGVFLPFAIPPILLPLVALFAAPVIAVALISNLPKRI